MIMKDKLLHIFWGAVFAGIVALPVYNDSHDLFAGLWACLSGVIAAGVKEWCDMRTDKWDWLDFGCTVIGAVVVALFIVGMHYGRG